MRARNLVAEAVFATMVLGSVAVPQVLLPRVQQGSGTSGDSGQQSSGGSGGSGQETGTPGSSGGSGQETGSAGGSGGSGQETGSAGGSGGSGQGPDRGGGQGGDSGGGTAGGSGSGAGGGAAGGGGGSSEGGGSGGGGGPRPSGSPRPPEEFTKAIPAVGTLIEATIRNLPPFLLLACLLGLVAGTDPLPPSSLGPDAANAIAEACSRVRVKPLDLGDGPFGSSRQRVDPDDVRLFIHIEPGPIVVVEQRLPDRTNRNLLTLLAALVLVVVAVGVGYAIGSRRRPDPGVHW